MTDCSCDGSGVLGYFEHVSPDTGEHLGNEPVLCPCQDDDTTDQTVVDTRPIDRPALVQKLKQALARRYNAKSRGDDGTS